MGARMRDLVIPEGVTGIRLCKIVKGELIQCVPVFFAKGAPAVNMIFLRAAVCGKVGPIGEAGDFWADLMTPDGCWVETVALSREAWKSIKGHWAPTKIDRGWAVKRGEK